MLRLRRCILTRLLSSPSATYTISPLHRLLSAAAAVAPSVSSSPSLAAEDYLIGTWGLTRSQALKASARISHIKFPSKPDAVLAFLAGLGLSGADAAAVVAKDPQFLCAKVERTLAPIVAGLTGLGLSPTEIARLVSIAPSSFRCKTIISNLPYYMSLFGSYENFLRAVKRQPYFLTSDLETVVKPNVAFLKECELGACDIASLCLAVPRILCTKPDRLRAMVVCAQGLGVPRGSAMFRHALHAVAFLTEEKIAAQVENFKNMLRWSDSEVRIAVSKLPIMLRRCKHSLHSTAEFLISEVGLEPAYIAHRPALLSYSLERRLRPRYYVLKFLKQNGLLDHDRDYFSSVTCIEKVFLEKFICPHKEAAPHLAEDYEAACRGEVPTRFRFA